MLTSLLTLGARRAAPVACRLPSSSSSARALLNRNAQSIQKSLLSTARRGRPAKTSSTSATAGDVGVAGYASMEGTAGTTSRTGSMSGRKLLVAGLTGIGAISVGLLGGKLYEGLSQAGTIHDNSIWPQYVKDRVANSFMAFGFGVLATAASATMLFRMGAATFFATRPMLSFIGSIGLMMGTGAVARAVPADAMPLKYASLGLFNFAVGLALCPIVALGGPILARAAMMTGGIVGSLALVAMNSPSSTYLTMGAPLAMGLGAICIANIASIFVPSMAAAGLLYNISLYGGLVVFSGFCLYDTSVMIERAKRVPDGEYDAVAESMSIFMDAVNIFIRIAMILANGKSNKK